MTQRKHIPSYTAEFRARGVRLFNEQRSEYRSDNAAYQAIAPKLGCAPDSPRGWCRQSGRDAGARNGPTSEERARIKELEREVRELDTEEGFRVFCSGGTRPPFQEMISFIE
tara:strand:- start:263 stop:598 length:336 start_codon:yes stop_codon:yes gene_type:complete